MTENHTNDEDTSVRIRNLQVHQKVSHELYDDPKDTPGNLRPDRLRYLAYKGLMLESQDRPPATPSVGGHAAPRQTRGSRESVRLVVLEGGEDE